MVLIVSLCRLRVVDLLTFANPDTFLFTTEHTSTY